MNGLVGVIIALLSVGGAAAIDAGRKWYQASKSSKSATTKTLVSNLNEALATSDKRAATAILAKDRELQEERGRRMAAEVEIDYWRSRAGELAYQLSADHGVKVDPARPPTRGAKL